MSDILGGFVGGLTSLVFLWLIGWALGLGDGEEDEEDEPEVCDCQLCKPHLWN